MDKHAQKIIRIARKALKMGKRLELEYDGLPRLVEVHCVGVSRTGKPCLRVYQVLGESHGHITEGWKLLSIGKITQLPKLIDQDSLGPREGYVQNDSQMIEVIDQL